MHYKLVPLILLSSILFLCNDVEAGFNGDEPIGNDWIIDQYTHVWDEDISIENIALNNGGLILENVTLYLTGDFYLKADAEWINSNITYDKKDKTNQLTVETNLYLINTTLGINSTIDHVFNATIEGILLEPNSELIITDSDNNPLTQYDQSRLYSLNWNNSDSEFTSLEIWSPGNGKVNINNSHISHYALIKSHNNNVTFTNNTFDE